jgi:hypothetical protein
MPGSIFFKGPDADIDVIERLVAKISAMFPNQDGLSPSERRI